METIKLKGQSIWGWKVAIYLFLAGVGAGAYAVGAVADLAGGEWRLISKVGIGLGAPLVGIGTLFLIWDLGKPGKFFRAGTSLTGLTTSWIARGVVILSIFTVLGAVHFAVWVWPFHSLEDPYGLLRHPLSMVNGFFALLTMIYTGILLGTVRPILFWSNAILPFLFLVSALSTGIMGIALGLTAYYGVAGDAPGMFIFVGRQLSVLKHYDILLLAVEAVILAFYLLYSSLATRTSRASVFLLINGEMAVRFWGGVVLAGLLVPLLVQVIEVSHVGTEPSISLLMTLSAVVPGLAGGLLLRHLVIAGGVKSPLDVAGMLVATPTAGRGSNAY